MLTNRSVPSSTVVPVLVYEDVPAAVEWLCASFGFAERLRIGIHRAQLSLGEGAVILTEPQTVGDGPELCLPRRGEVSQYVHVRVEDADQHHEHAVEHGVRVVQPLSDHPYGERQYTAEDLAGHRWTFSQSIADVAPDDWGGTTP